MSVNNFLTSLGRTERVDIRCLLPKRLPLEVAESLGMAFRYKDDKLVCLPISGSIDLKSEAFTRTYSNGKTELIADGLGYLQTLNQQGYGVYFVPHHGTGFKAADITHGTTLFHESDRLSIDAQQSTIDRISAEFGEPTAVVRTRKSLHVYYRCTEDIQVERLATLERRWLQYSECDDPSLADPAQLMRMPGFDHVSWNGETRELERVQCELIHLSSVAYSLEQFDKILPPLDLERWVKSSLEVCHKDTTETDIRAFSEYLDGFKANGRKGWITAKCPAHNGDSEDSLHINHESGGFICHAWCTPSAVYQAVKSVAIARGYRLTTSEDSGIESEVKRFLDEGSVKPPQILADSIQTPLDNLAKSLGLGVDPFIVCILPIIASRLKAGTRLLIDPATDYYAPAIIWAGLVGDSGTLKTPILKALTRPLDDLQKEAFEDYQRLYSEYEMELQRWDSLKKDERADNPKPKPPALKDLYFSDFTIEAIADSMRYYPDEGYLIHIDELAAFFKSMDAYRNGKGSDRQRWLTSHSGAALKVNRKSSEPIYLNKTAVSIVGGIQPQVLEKQVLDDPTSEDGLWARFFWYRLQMTTSPGISDSPRFDLSHLLRELYRSVNKLEAKTYSLSREAIAIWNEWNRYIGELIKQEPSGILRATYPKLKEGAARIALISHITNAVLSGVALEQRISADTLTNAIEFTRWLMGQTRMLYCEIGTGDNPKASRIIKLVKRFVGCGWLKTRTVRDWWTGKDKPSAQNCRKWMGEVVALGYAEDNGSKIEDSNYQIRIVVHVVHDQLKPHIQQGKQVGTTPSPCIVHLVHDQSQSHTDEQKKDSERTTWTTDGLRVVHDSISCTVSDSEHDGLYGLPSVDLITEPDESKSNDVMNQSNQEQTGDDIREFSATDAQGLKRGWIEMDVEPSNPRDALSIADGRITVDLEQLDLNHQPSVDIPQWHPKTALKPYEQLSKLYLDIETTGLDPVKDRVIMVGLMDENGQKTILSDPLEKAILKELIEFLRVHKPDLLIGHNLFGFDLPFIIERCKRKGITQPFRQGRKTQRITSASMNGKPIEFTSVYWTGVNIIDTMQQIAVWDKQASRLVSYGLKPSTIALGLRDERRLELSNDEIQQGWQSGDISTLGQYLNYDLEDTALLADFLLPVVYYQMGYVPGLSFQELAIASPALKAQKIHQALLPNLTPDADEPLKYEGGKVDLLAPGLHRNVAKIDVSSLYPSVMLRYGVCSKKDPDHRFLGVMAYMTQERLKLKEQAKQGDKAASFQEKSLKILINGSYGFLGTGGYTFNDFEAAALVTAYGRKILNLMMDVVSSCGATVVEVDTDGIFFSHDEPKAVYDLVQDALPEGINIELELENCGLYAPKAKSYVIVYPNGKTTVKGLFRKRDRYPLEREFPVEFLRLYFTESPEAAKVYYNSIRESILNRSIPVDQLTITRRIGAAEKTLVELGLGKTGDRVSFWYTEQQRVHGRSGKALKSVRLETQTAPYWIDYYLQQLDELYQSITGDGSLRLAELPLFQEKAA
jgi:DNA polymerase, archaea type